MLKQRKKWIVFLTLLLVAAAFRIAVAHWLPNDAPDDGKTYAQIARNVLEQHVYSHATEAPYDPSLIRLPGYPLFLAGVYSVFGHTNNGAVRIVQALIDTGTCALVALLAFYWEPDEKLKRATAIAALALAVVCPFTTIYAATILTEVPTTFLVMAMLLAATLALRNTFTIEDREKPQTNYKSFRHGLLWWGAAGLLGGLAVLLRPDGGLFVAAVGITLVISGAWHLKREWRKTLAAGAVLSLVFMLVLAPWTIRNARVFHLFQPIAPLHTEMPGEFVPVGYSRWLKTWLDDERDVGPVWWALNSEPITIDQIPTKAFDSAEERSRVEALLDQYDHPSGLDAAKGNAVDTEQQQASAPPPVKQSQSANTPVPARPGTTTAQKGQPQNSSQSNKAANENDNANPDNAGDKNDQDEDSDDQGDEKDNNDESDQTQAEEHGAVEMTPQIDAGFAQIASERVARHPGRFYVWLPIKRVGTMWLNTHAQYWPFDGELFPIDELDHETHQQFWLPLFAGLTWLYTVVGIVGGWVLWRSRKFAARKWLLLAMLLIFLRLVLLSTLESPEARYTVEFFPLLAVLGGIAVVRTLSLFKWRFGSAKL
jgi:hypothetical protein